MVTSSELEAEESPRSTVITAVVPSSVAEAAKSVPKMTKSGGPTDDAAPAATDKPVTTETASTEDKNSASTKGEAGTGSPEANQGETAGDRNGQDELSPTPQPPSYSQGYPPHLTPQQAGQGYYPLGYQSQVTPEPPSPGGPGATVYDVGSFFQQQGAFQQHNSPFVPGTPSSPRRAAAMGGIPPASPLFPRVSTAAGTAGLVPGTGIDQRIMGAPPSPSVPYLTPPLGPNSMYPGYAANGIGGQSDSPDDIAAWGDRYDWVDVCSDVPLIVKSTTFSKYFIFCDFYCVRVHCYSKIIILLRNRNQTNMFPPGSPQLNAQGLPVPYVPGMTRASAGRAYSFDDPTGMLPPAMEQHDQGNPGYAQYGQNQNSSGGAGGTLFANQQPFGYGGGPVDMYGTPGSPLQPRPATQMPGYPGHPMGGGMRQMGPYGQYYPATSPGPPIQTTESNKGPDGANLFIFHIPNHFTNLDMYQLFCPYGNLLSVRIMVEKDTGRSRGFGFVSYDSVASAALAIKDLNGFAVRCMTEVLICFTKWPCHLLTYFSLPLLGI